MRIFFDPETLRSQMALRRAATDMKLPMNERLKVHFMTHRAQLLSNFSLTAGAWMMLLHGCKAEPIDRDELEALKAEVIEFKAWAEDGLQELRRMDLQETIGEDADDAMPDDPQLVAALRKMLDLPFPKDERDRRRT